MVVSERGSHRPAGRAAWRAHPGYTQVARGRARGRGDHRHTGTCERRHQGRPLRCLSSVAALRDGSPEAGDQVTPGEGRVELFGGPFDSKSRYKWLRAVVVPGGDIYGIPAGADDVVKIRLPNQVRYRLSRRTWREYYTFQATDT